MGVAIGVDIGGTKIAAGVVDEHGHVLDRETYSTPGQDVGETESVIVAAVHALLQRCHQDVLAVGIGAAGWIGADRARVLFSPHLAWRNEPLHAALAARIDVPLLVENDANAAAWAEYRFGAARGHPVVVCITLGTGIGGGLVIHGSLYRGGYGVAAEFGHMALVPDGRLCACGNRGCWEMYASGRALASDAAQLATASPAVAAALLARAGGEPLSGTLVAAAAADGDPAAVTICTTMGRWLGRGLANLAAALDPTIFVIGGGVSAVGELLLRPTREEYVQALAGRGFRPVAVIERAQLRAEAGLIGAADLARAACEKTTG